MLQRPSWLPSAHPSKGEIKTPSCRGQTDDRVLCLRERFGEEWCYSAVSKTRLRRKSGPKTVSVGPQCLFRLSKPNSSRLPASNANLIEQKTLNSNIPLGTRIASLWRGRCPKDLRNLSR